MNDAKITYRSEGVVVATGEGAVAKAAALTGHPPEYTEAMHGFAKEILEQAVDRGLTPEQCYTACLNAMCLIIEIAAKNDEQKSRLVSLTTEAFCAFVGGGSDQGVRS